MPFYSFPFSLMVVERFTNTHPRGWHCLVKNLDNFYMEDLAQIFQTSQMKWNILKKLIKLVERTWRPNYYTDVKLRELYTYFYHMSTGACPSKALDKLYEYRDKV